MNHSRVFIEQATHNQSQVSVFLISGINLKGQITFNGDDSFILTRDGISQLVMLQALATILPVS